jgi:hypothetical protein
MKIKSITVLLTWEDGIVDEVSSYLPSQTFSDLEQFSDYWEKMYGDEEDKDESDDEYGEEVENG